MESLTFGPQTSTITLAIPVLDDLAVESVEMFFADLTLTTLSSNVLVDPDLATISITDDDGKN